MALNTELNDRFKKLRIRALQRMPFFGTLLLHAHVTEGNMSNGVMTMATDGHTIFMNPDFSNSLSDEEFTGVLLHEVLHMALKHVARAQNLEEPVVVNLAADIIVNGILRDNNITLPSGAFENNDLKNKSLHEIYWILMQQIAKQPKSAQKKSNQCLRPDLKEEGAKQRKKDMGGDGDDNKKEDKSGNGEQQENGDGDTGDEQNSGGNGDKNKETNGNDNFEVEWDDVLTKAETINRMSGRSLSGGGLERLFKELREPRINWRDVLYRYITTFPTDFTGWDRRYLHDDIYIEDLDGTRNEVLVFIDTSGSVSTKLLTEFLSEIKGAVNATPNISGEIYQFDTGLYSMGDIKEYCDFPKMVGGGGTDFDLPIRCANERQEELGDISNILVIIFTDGFAPMPKAPQGYDVLWAVCPNGPENKYFTFGDVIRVE